MYFVTFMVESFQMRFSLYQENESGLSFWDLDLGPTGSTGHIYGYEKSLSFSDLLFMITVLVSNLIMCECRERFWYALINTLIQNLSLSQYSFYFRITFIFASKDARYKMAKMPT